MKKFILSIGLLFFVFLPLMVQGEVKKDEKLIEYALCALGSGLHICI